MKFSRYSKKVIGGFQEDSRVFFEKSKGDSVSKKSQGLFESVSMMYQDTLMKF